MIIRLESSLDLFPHITAIPVTIHTAITLVVAEITIRIPSYRLCLAPRCAWVAPEEIPVFSPAVVFLRGPPIIEELYA